MEVAAQGYNYPQEKPDPEFWKDFLNQRAGELGLEQNVKIVTPREGVGMLTWVYETGDGSLVDLGWNVEEAEAALRTMAAKG